MSSGLLCIGLWLLIVVPLLFGRYPGEEWLLSQRRRRAAAISGRARRCDTCESPAPCCHAPS